MYQAIYEKRIYYILTDSSVVAKWQRDCNNVAALARPAFAKYRAHRNTNYLAIVAGYAILPIA